MTGSQIERVAQIEIPVTDLNGPLLGEATPLATALDVNSAGHGWFVDPTPDRRDGFRTFTRFRLQAGDGRPTARHVDLLSAVMHELGHVSQIDHADHSDDARKVMK